MFGSGTSLKVGRKWSSPLSVEAFSVFSLICMTTPRSSFPARLCQSAVERPALVQPPLKRLPVDADLQSPFSERLRHTLPSNLLGISISDRLLHLPLAAPLIASWARRYQVLQSVVLRIIVQVIDVHVDPSHLLLAVVALKRAGAMLVVEPDAMLVLVAPGLTFAQRVIRCIHSAVSARMHDDRRWLQIVERAVSAKASVMHFAMASRCRTGCVLAVGD